VPSQLVSPLSEAHFSENINGWAATVMGYIRMWVRVNGWGTKYADDMTGAIWSVGLDSHYLN